MTAEVMSVIAEAFIAMIPTACFIGICTRVGRMLVRVCSGGEELL
jgi:hypothetical protein